MPAFPLIFNPVGHHVISVKILARSGFARGGINRGRNGDSIFGYAERFGINQRFVLIAPPVSLRRLEAVMNSFMGKVYHKRLVGFVLLFYKVNGMFGKEIRDVCAVLVLNPFAIRVDPGIVILTLTFE